MEKTKSSNRRLRQILGIVCALVAYNIIHEGAHLIAALSMGVFKKINLLGFGLQVDVFAERMSDTQMGVFCLVGALATMLTGVVLTLLTDRFCKAQSAAFKAVMYYITMAMLILDPMYLSVVYKFVGGGDMNGIALLVPEMTARVVAAVLFLVGVFVFWRVVLPKYNAAFTDEQAAEIMGTLSASVKEEK